MKHNIYHETMISETRYFESFRYLSSSVLKRNTVLEFIISSGNPFHLSIVLTQKEFNLPVTDFNDLGFMMKRQIRNS